MLKFKEHTQIQNLGKDLNCEVAFDVMDNQFGLFIKKENDISPPIIGQLSLDDIVFFRDSLNILIENSKGNGKTK